MIEVHRTGDGDPMAFSVTVTDGGGQSHHQVSMARDVARRLTEHHSPEQCVEAAFHFLLDREPKESILARFDITAISRYFPEFETKLPEYLADR